MRLINNDKIHSGTDKKMVTQSSIHTKIINKHIPGNGSGNSLVSLLIINGMNTHSKNDLKWSRHTELVEINVKMDKKLKPKTARYSY